MNKFIRNGSGISLPWALIRSAYYLVFLPCAIFFAAVTLIVFLGTSVRHEIYPSDYFLLAMLWIFIIFPLGFRYVSIKLRHKKLLHIVDFLKSDKRFNPKANLEVFSAAKGKYLGIDNKRGTI